jgi:hypothetical protein
MPSTSVEPDPIALLIATTPESVTVATIRVVGSGIVIASGRCV